MKLDKDFNEFVELFVANDVRFLVVGGYALAAHGYPRATDDFDAWVWANPENAVKIVDCLTKVQLGYPPYRIDIITSISGVEFDSAWENRLVVDVDGLNVPFIGREDLLKNKRATGRPKDLLDVERLTGN